jgi:hypothetical protein
MPELVALVVIVVAYFAGPLLMAIWMHVRASALDEWREIHRMVTQRPAAFGAT